MRRVREAGRGVVSNWTKIDPFYPTTRSWTVDGFSKRDQCRPLFPIQRRAFPRAPYARVVNTHPFTSKGTFFFEVSGWLGRPEDQPRDTCARRFRPVSAGFWRDRPDQGTRRIPRKAGKTGFLLMLIVTTSKALVTRSDALVPSMLIVTFLDAYHFLRLSSSFDTYISGSIRVSGAGNAFLLALGLHLLDETRNLNLRRFMGPLQVEDLANKQTNKNLHTNAHSVTPS